jgi:PAS domain S-box-containing protein
MGTRERDVQVLHVDDDPEFADLVATFLETATDRLAVETVDGASVALEYIEAKDVDCVVSDYEMPEADGIELLESVREQWADLPFILFTARGSEAIASDAISAGVTDYLQKGTGSEQYDILANRIRNAVERMRAQRDRRRNLEAIENAQEGISILDDEGRFVYVNQAYADLYGYDPEDLEGERWERLYRDADAEAMREAVQPRLEAEGTWHGRTTGLRADGTTFREDHTLATTEAGEVICTVQDVTEREERKRRFETLVDNLPGMVYRCQNEPGWPMENLRGDVEKLTGYPAATIEETDGFYGDELIHPDDRERIWETVQAALEDRESFEVTYRIRTRDGQTKWVWEQGQGVFTEDGGLEALEGFVTDVTEKRETMEALREERAFVEQALDTLNDLFYVLDTEGNVERWNDSIAAVTGYDPDEIESMHAREFFPEEHHDSVASAIEQTLKTGEVTFDAELLRKDGERLPYEFTGARVTGPDGNVTGIVGIGRRIEDRGE